MSCLLIIYWVGLSLKTIHNILLQIRLPWNDRVVPMAIEIHLIFFLGELLVRSYYYPSLLIISSHSIQVIY